MARRKTHDDVDFTVKGAGQAGGDIYYKTFDEAAARAVGEAVATGKSTIDILVWSRRGAKWLGGDDSVEQYNEDPEASVFERIEIKANIVGRVP
jgi:hypothetical protein